MSEDSAGIGDEAEAFAMLVYALDRMGEAIEVNPDLAERFIAVLVKYGAIDPGRSSSGE